MAKPSAKEKIVSLLSDDETIPRPRLSKLNQEFSNNREQSC